MAWAAVMRPRHCVCSLTTRHLCFSTLSRSQRIQHQLECSCGPSRVILKQSTSIDMAPAKLHTTRVQVQRRSPALRRHMQRRAIAAEQAVSAAPDSLLRDEDKESAVKVRFENIIRTAQDRICAAVSEMDGKAFHEDAWTREDGGGGISRVLQDGNVWEKAGVNVSVVYGSMPPQAYRAATERNVEIPENAGRVPFFAAGISSVMHPHNPHAPTMHFNYRYFQTAEWEGVPPQWWYGGGTDITPAYVYDEDMKHFHGSYKQVCDNHDPEWYPRFRKWADDYFVIPHRGERRGLGGIFFDDLADRSQDEVMNFSEEAVNAVVPSYLPLVEKRKDTEFTEAQKEWQQMRRGRYVEFNLVYDRGTTFGLRTGGRIESILMSLPLTARWEYMAEPEAGSEEARMLELARNPIDWTA
eukprot:jgi/Ulvmu1/8383/UM042_0090.1